KEYDVWIARYSEFKPFVHLLHWQLTYRGRVSGITGDVDINVFNGNREQFNEYKKEHCIK
ncbi:MAG: glycosyl hydrolase family 25, partial [Bacteroidales bacterium]